MKLNILILCLLLIITIASCKKNQTSQNTNQLPPATQTGANTFGCYINGSLFVPQGYKNPFPNYELTVDSGASGDFSIHTYKIINGVKSDFGINGANVYNAGNFPISSSTTVFPFYFRDANSNDCWFTTGVSIPNYRSGYLKITRYDLANGIFSGEFEMNLYDSTISCDTIRITQGRFDKKL